MRKIIVAEFISVDGVVEAPERWHFPYVNEEMFGVMWALNAEADTMLLGRVTYQSFAGAFANAPADDPVAAQMNKPAKVVVSKTLNDPVAAGRWRRRRPAVRRRRAAASRDPARIRLDPAPGQRARQR